MKKYQLKSAVIDQVLLEDRQTNRLEESRTIFDAIVNNRIFTNVSIILFLNKSDLLRAKVSCRSHVKYNLNQNPYISLSDRLEEELKYPTFSPTTKETTPRWNPFSNSSLTYSLVYDDTSLANYSTILLVPSTRKTFESCLTP